MDKRAAVELEKEGRASFILPPSLCLWIDCATETIWIGRRGEDRGASRGRRFDAFLLFFFLLFFSLPIPPYLACLGSLDLKGGALRLRLDGWTSASLIVLRLNSRVPG